MFLSVNHFFFYLMNRCFQKNGKTPLHYAVESLQLEAARYILGHGSGEDSDRDMGGDSLPNTERRDATGIKLLDASQRTKLEVKKYLRWFSAVLHGAWPWK